MAKWNRVPPPDASGSAWAAELELRHVALRSVAGLVADTHEQRGAREPGAARVVVELRPRRGLPRGEREVVVPHVEILVPARQHDLGLAVLVDVGHGGRARTSPASRIGKPGNMVAVAPDIATSWPSSPPQMMSLKPSPLMSATTGLDSDAPLVCVV
jgi:hypothetical protein